MRPGTEIGPNPYYAAARSQKDIYPPFRFFGRLPGATARRESLFGVAVGCGNCRSAKRLVYYAMFAETNGLTGRGCFDLQVESLDGVADTSAASGKSGHP